MQIVAVVARAIEVFGLAPVLALAPCGGVGAGPGHPFQRVARVIGVEPVGILAEIVAIAVAAAQGAGRRPGVAIAVLGTAGRLGALALQQRDLIGAQVAGLGQAVGALPEADRGAAAGAELPVDTARVMAEQAQALLNPAPLVAVEPQRRLDPGRGVGAADTAAAAAPADQAQPGADRAGEPGRPAQVAGRVHGPGAGRQELAHHFAGEAAAPPLAAPHRPARRRGRDHQHIVAGVDRAQSGLGNRVGGEALELGGVDEHHRAPGPAPGQAQHQVERHPIHHHPDQRGVALVDRRQIGDSVAAQGMAGEVDHHLVGSGDLGGKAPQRAAHLAPVEVDAEGDVVAAIDQRLGDLAGVDRGALGVGRLPVIVITDHQGDIGGRRGPRKKHRQADNAYETHCHKPVHRILPRARLPEV